MMTNAQRHIPAIATALMLLLMNSAAISNAQTYFAGGQLQVGLALNLNCGSETIGIVDNDLTKCQLLSVGGVYNMTGYLGCATDGTFSVSLYNSTTSSLDCASSTLIFDTTGNNRTCYSSNALIDGLFHSVSVLCPTYIPLSSVLIAPQFLHGSATALPYVSHVLMLLALLVSLYLV